MRRNLALDCLILGLAGDVVVAHGPSREGLPVPNFMAGRDALEAMRESRKQAIERRVTGLRSAKDSDALVPALQTRQAGRCGPNFGDQVCEDGYCCSSAGYVQTLQPQL